MAPFSTDLIEDVDNLFGRGNLLNCLDKSILGNINLSIIGTRRYGKTCLLKTIEKKYLNKQSSPCIPIYLDFKGVCSAVKTTADVYRYIISQVLVLLYKREVLSKEEMINNRRFRISPSWSDVFGQMNEIDSGKMLDLFSVVMSTLADLCEKPFLLLFDEYEFLIKHVLDQPDDFFNIRNISTIKTEFGRKIFFIWVAGVEMWNTLGKQTGSGIGNCITQHEEVMPIDWENFDAMWDYECSLVEDEEERDRLLAEKTFVWEASGGVPFYAKVIGAYLWIKNNRPTNDVLKPFFDEIFNGNLSISQRLVLKQLSTRPRNLIESEEVKSLIQHGLVYYDKQHKVHNLYSGMFKEYMKNIDLRTVQTAPYTHNIVDEICRLIENINALNMGLTETSDHEGYPIFKAVNQAGSLFIDMKQVATDKTLMTTFALAVYRTYLERSEGLNAKGIAIKGYLLPKRFSKMFDPSNPEKGAFARAVDRLRQSYAHNSESAKPTEHQMREIDMLYFFTGKYTLPSKPEEYKELQKSVLDKMKTELQNMLDSLEKKGL